MISTISERILVGSRLVDRLAARVRTFLLLIFVLLYITIFYFLIYLKAHQVSSTSWLSQWEVRYSLYSSFLSFNSIYLYLILNIFAEIWLCFSEPNIWWEKEAAFWRSIAVSVPVHGAAFWPTEQRLPWCSTRKKRSPTGASEIRKFFAFNIKSIQFFLNISLFYSSTSLSKTYSATKKNLFLYAHLLQKFCKQNFETLFESIEILTKPYKLFWK